MTMNADELFEEGYRLFELSLNNEAKAILEPLAEQGHTGALRTLGDMYMDGWDDVPEDREKAFEFYRKAAELGDVESMYNLAKYPKRRTSVSIEWGRKAAEQGYVPAQILMGELYEKGLPGVLDRDEEQALEWYRKASAQGSYEGQYHVGRMLLAKGHTDAAILWLHKAATENKESPFIREAACIALGDIHAERGEDAQALEWYRKGVTSEAYYKIGRLLQMKGDDENAFQYFLKAAEWADKDAMYELGNMYASGWGQHEKDMDKAVEYYDRAARYGHPEAREMIRELYESLDTPRSKGTSLGM